MEIKKVDAIKAVSKKVTCNVKDIAQVMGQTYGEISQMAGSILAGVPYVIYLNEDMEALEMELGFPTQADEAPAGLEITEVPAGEVAAAVHKGSYSTLEKTYIELMSFIEKEGRQKESWMYEWYLNDPKEVSEDEYLTEVMIPLK